MFRGETWLAVALLLMGVVLPNELVVEGVTQGELDHLINWAEAHGAWTGDGAISIECHDDKVGCGVYAGRDLSVCLEGMVGVC